MNMFKRFVSGLGQQSAPFGFAPDDPNASYQAGLAYMGDLGASIMANNRGGVDPFVNLGASLQDARSMSTDRNKQQWTAARLKEEAELKRQERERADADRKRREDYINTLPADVRMKALSIPGYLDSWISANDPALQKPEEPKLYNMGDALVDANGNIVYQGNGGGAGGKSYAPIPYDMGNGRVGYGIPMEDGSFRPVEIPEGAQFISPFDKAFQTSSGTARGKIVTEQELSAPSDIAAADQALGLLDQITSHPALERGTGFTSLGNAIPGTAGYDFQNLVEQAKSGAFLTAIDQLRGMGALSNMEGQAATAAVTRMDTATSEEAFLKAVQDYRNIVDAGRQKAMARSRQTAPTNAADDPLGLR